MTGSHERVNLMLEQASRVVTDKNELLEALGGTSCSCTGGQRNPDNR